MARYSIRGQRCLQGSQTFWLWFIIDRTTTSRYQCISWNEEIKLVKRFIEIDGETQKILEKTK